MPNEQNVVQQIRFDNGAAYEREMGTWSQLAGAVFLDWLALAPGLRWIDVGCGNGAFTELIACRHAPASVEGIDPSEGQLAFARGRQNLAVADFRQGDAMSLPYPDSASDVSVMALVLFFVPEPKVGVAEMVRVTRSGGTVAAYAWDILGGGFPHFALQTEMRAVGLVPPLPPSVEASRIDAMLALWKDAGLQDVETREITIQRVYDSFDDLWEIALLGASGPRIMAMPESERQQLRAAVQGRLPPEPDGKVIVSARANAVKGRVAR